MDEARLNKLRVELDKARKKRDEWDTKVKNLERRYSEAEKVCVYGIFQAANLTPEQLAEVIKNAAGLPRIHPQPAGCGNGRQRIDGVEHARNGFLYCHHL